MNLGKDRSPNIQATFINIAPTIARKIPYKEKKIYDRLVGLVADLKKSTVKDQFIRDLAGDAYTIISDSFFRQQLKIDVSLKEEEEKLVT